MLKETESLKALIQGAAQSLQELLAQVPAVRVGQMEVEPRQGGNTVDLLVHVEVQNQRRVLVCEVKSNGQPRNVRMALHQLLSFAANLEKEAVPVLIAPYLSPAAQALCREGGAAYLDLLGNARITFDGIFIERIVERKPHTERRALRSLFKPKSAQVLSALLQNPARPWRVTELAEESSVSLGHVSNVRAALLAREWAQVSEEGLFLADPDALLDAWRDEYEPPKGSRTGFYTTLHGAVLEKAVRLALGTHPESGNAIFASFSAAQWLAPYGRTGSQYFYADGEGLKKLKYHLQLSAISKGENVVVTQPNDKGLFRDSIEPASGIFCTSLVQTYLDLTAAGERGREAADHLRQERLAWRT